MSFEETGAAVGRLVDEKNKAYEQSFDHAGDILRRLYPDGVAPNQYGDLLAIVRILDKMFRSRPTKTPSVRIPGLT